MPTAFPSFLQYHSIYYQICKVPSIIAMLKLLLGVGKARPTCCGVVCLGGFFVVCFLGDLSVSRV